MVAIERIEALVNEAKEKLLVMNERREEAVKRSRDWLARCREAIAAARRLEDAEGAERELRNVIDEVREFLKEGGDCPDPSITKVLDDVLQEAVEGISVSRLLRGLTPPGFEELGIGPKEYVLGLADAVGELRRAALTLLLEGRIEEAEKIARAMEAIYEPLSSIVLPDSFLPLRRKVDTARGLIERTLSEILVAKSSRKVR